MSKLSSAGGAIALAAVTAGTNYLALLTFPPNDATLMTTMTEVTTAGYARQTMLASNWTTPTGQPSTSSNIASIVFGPFTVATVLISWLALVSASSGTTGTLTMYWSLNSPLSFSPGQTLTIPANALVMSIA